MQCGVHQLYSPGGIEAFVHAGPRKQENISWATTIDIIKYQTTKRDTVVY